MRLWSNTRWMLFFFLFLNFSTLALVKEIGAKAGGVGTQTCISCHRDWLDNDPPIEDELSLPVGPDYVPFNLAPSHTAFPFYTIPEGYVSSIHYTPSFNTSLRDFVTCENCHGSGLSHFGLGPIPKPIPQADTCGSCHKKRPSNKALSFDFNAYLLTAHANKNRRPGKYFDQPSNGASQARTTFPNLGKTVSLFQSDQSTPVTRNQRIDECSVCHSYALQYPQFQDKISQNNMPNPQVSCGACHNSHIVGPNGRNPAIVNSTVKVTGITGSNVTAVTPVDGRNIFYVNNKPYKVKEDGSQDTVNGIWTRGSAFNRPQPVIFQGTGTISNSNNGVADIFNYTTGGFLYGVQPGYTLFISGKASATVKLPADALNPGAPVTAEATLDQAGFLIQSAQSDQNIILGTFDQTLVLETREDPARNQLIAQLGTDKIGVVANVPVTYKKATGTGTLNVFVPFIGTFNFEIRDMRTNTETLCQSCHTQGKHKYTAWGKKKDGTFIDLSSTHNTDIGGQYRRSGHADKNAIPFLEFSSFEYGSSHQPTFPFDMSITGSGGLNSLRNKGNTTYKLTQTPNAANVYLGSPNLTDQVVLINNYVCNQCHHGLGAIDYMKDRQGSLSARVLWGDATVVCITCHDTHESKIEKNVRIPVKLSYNSAFVDAAKNPSGGINKFMDGTDIPDGKTAIPGTNPPVSPPPVGNGKVCLFCHQGRESGLTVYSAIKSKVDPYTNPNQVISAAGVSFINPHYLDGGSLLWSRNAWEFFFNGVAQSYTAGNANHQQLNCMDCHMGEANAENTEGGHTWKPRVETCQQCHGPITKFEDIVASGDYDGNGTVGTTFEEIGTIAPDGSSGTGLFGQLLTALQAKGIYYNPNSYPYFFTATGGQFRAFTSNTLAASFNLAWSYKSGNCVYWHNAKYIVQVLQDSLRALGVTPTGVRPSGNRNATDYRTIVVNP
jgi:hypothetical protein